jgi:hypothetical protein
MSWLSSFLNPGEGYNKAQEQYDQYYNQAQGYQQPYNQFGQNQQGTLQDYINSLHDPQALQDKWSKGYTESEAGKNAETAATQHGVNAAASMGMGGSNSAIHAIQAGTSQIGAADKQKYLDDLMEKYKTGAGLSQGIYNTGANAAGQQGQNAMNQGQRSGEAAYGRQNAGGNMLSGLIGTAAGVAGSALGGPIGGALAQRWNLSGR